VTRPGRKLLKNASNADIKMVAYSRGLEFTDEDCEELHRCRLIDAETVAQAVDDFIMAYE